MHVSGTHTYVRRSRGCWRTMPCLAILIVSLLAAIVLAEAANRVAMTFHGAGGRGKAAAGVQTLGVQGFGKQAAAGGRHLQAAAAVDPFRRAELPQLQSPSPGSAVVSPGVKCEQYEIITTGSNLASIATTFGTTVAGLRKLNPMLKEAELEPGVGTLLCVVGTVLANNMPELLEAGRTASTATAAQNDGRKYGKRPTDSVIAYDITPEVNIYRDIMFKAQPPLDIITLVKLNPMLDFSDLAKMPHTIFLPKGLQFATAETTATTSATVDNSSRNCLVGRWSDWSECSPGGTRVRYRNIYLTALGSGKPCPPDFETQPCNRTDGISRRKMLLTLTSSQCPDGYNGCSVPYILDGLGYYQHLFVPACNSHDICYGCHRHPAWRFATRGYCDEDVFYRKMVLQCEIFWQSSDKDMKVCKSWAS
ncbi:hypothetical protein Vafri_16065 [Volvox africanus]|uniref:LysM domain-containing protein n=1 Tax=Volvox africanus TaxID=51714 RepID=A0A8J4F994_9CHLO|nr:hypothetical protein Vafri_16065 [Volvox africanus]